MPVEINQFPSLPFISAPWGIPRHWAHARKVLGHYLLPSALQTGPLAGGLEVLLRSVPVSVLSSSPQSPSSPAELGFSQPLNLSQTSHLDALGPASSMFPFL